MMPLGKPLAGAIPPDGDSYVAWADYSSIPPFALSMLPIPTRSPRCARASPPWRSISATATSI